MDLTFWLVLDGQIATYAVLAQFMAAFGCGRPFRVTEISFPRIALADIFVTLCDYRGLLRGFHSEFAAANRAAGCPVHLYRRARKRAARPAKRSSRDSTFLS